ncbi:MAG: tryptophan--tRNA ligase [Dokdonella sp.]|mgnify:FL=1|uniref:tryptophan--tRNA ligase n=1 Tax=Dokdonella sp. TaxID=2291710 RepID=UPI003BAE2577
MTNKIRTLTGITTTGTPHLGNYVGAIRPAIAASRRADVESFYFLADYHALVKCEDPVRIAQSRLEIAATWLALGLDTERAFFYRQSDITEIPELTWLLTCVTAKGLLNRAHAYKAAVDRNVGDNEDGDAGINAGLFMYPVLMAADILIFNAQRVPVGRDQIQHIEMARDIAQRFNHLYGAAYRAATKADSDPFVLPEAVTDEDVATLPGLDGRKMSKSYNNTIPLWLSARDLKKAIFGIITDSLAPGQAKETEGSSIFSIYQAFASGEETAAMRQAFADGIGWADAKQKLFERIDAELAAPREQYNALISQPDEIEERLLAGAKKARERSAPLIAALREAVGLTSRLAAKSNAPTRIDAGSAGSAPPQWKRYREKDGLFYFKLVDGDGAVLLQSVGFHRPDEVGSAIARLMALLGQVAVDSAMLAMDGRIEVAGSVEAVQQALAMLEEIENRKRAAKDAQARAL